MPIRLGSKRGRRAKVVARSADASAAIAGTAISVPPIGGRIQSVIYDLTASIAGRYTASSLITGALSASIADLTAKLGTWAPPSTGAGVDFAPEPGVLVTSATGRFEDGATITIAGTGFGAGPNVVIYDQIPTGTVGSIVPLTAEIGPWNRYRGGSATYAPKVVSTPTRSGGLAVTGNDPTLASPRNLSREYIGPQFSEVFVCVSIAFRDGKIGSPASGSNMKLAWAYNGSTTSGNGTMDCVLGTWYDANSVGIAGNATVDTAFMLSRSLFKADKWNTMQAWLLPGNPIGVANDICYMRVDNTVTKGENTRGDKRIFGMAGRALYFTRVEVLGWHGNWTDAATFDPILDDVYIAIGPNSAARVMVGNAATWATCNDMAICQPVSWTDTQVDMKLRVGAFSDLTGKYLYLVNATNVPRLLGQFVEAAIDYNVSLSWSAPAGGDTNVAYYRVEWGKYLNGTFGDFIGSTRVPAPQTSVKLLLPPRGYAFRVVTVATDGEESQPAFLGTKMVAEPPTSLRPSVLAPIPPWIADTTVGLKAPHDLSSSGFAMVTPITGATYATIDIGPEWAGGGYVCSTANRRYRLTCDITTDTWAFEIRANNVLIDLNGHTITWFNKSGPVASNSTDLTKCAIWGCISASIQGNVEIVNGYVKQGAGTVTNDPSLGYGRGANAIRLDSLSSMAGKSVYYRGLHITHNAKYAGAIYHHNTSDPSVLVENCTFKDEGNLVYVRTNVHHEVRIAQYSNPTEVRYCRFIDCRQAGTDAKFTHHNEIRCDSWWTNAQCVGANNGSRIYANNLYHVGTHPQCVFVRDTVGAKVYDNWMESKYTRCGELLPTTTGGIDNVQNFATGITFRFGDDSNFECYGNTMLQWASNDTVLHPVTGETWDAECRNLFYFKYPASAALANNRLYANLMAAISEDTVARAFCVGVSGTATELTIDTNRLVSNWCHFWIHDEYGSGYGLVGSPELQIRDNLVERIGANTSYKTIRHGAPNGGPLSTTALVTFESNDWKGGSWPISSANLTSGHVITYISEPGSVS